METQKKEALINGEDYLLPELAIAYRDKNGGFESLSHREDMLPDVLEGSRKEEAELNKVILENLKKVTITMEMKGRKKK